MFGNKVGKIVSDNVTITQVKEISADVAGSVAERVIETSAEAITAGAKGFISGILFTIGMWIVATVAAVSVVIYGIGAMFN